MINIDVYSDFVCPFCYIGKTELEHAAQTLGLEDNINLTYKAYELNPNAPSEQGETIHEEMAKKYGKDPSEIKEMTEGIVDRAESVGLTYNFENMYSQNTLKAHRLAKYAKEEGLEQKYTDHLFEAAFKDNEFLADNDTLIRLAKEIGLDTEKVKEVVKDDSSYLDQVNEDKDQAGSIGIQGVPFFVINNKYAIQGAQPQEGFQQALKKVAEEKGI